MSLRQAFHVSAGAALIIGIIFVMAALFSSTNFLRAQESTGSSVETGYDPNCPPGGSGGSDPCIPACKHDGTFSEQSRNTTPCTSVAATAKAGADTYVLGDTVTVNLTVSGPTAGSDNIVMLCDLCKKYTKTESTPHTPSTPTYEWAVAGSPNDKGNGNTASFVAKTAGTLTITFTPTNNPLCSNPSCNINAPTASATVTVVGISLKTPTNIPWEKSGNFDAKSLITSECAPNGLTWSLECGVGAAADASLDPASGVLSFGSSGGQYTVTATCNGYNASASAVINVCKVTSVSLPADKYDADTDSYVVPIGYNLLGVMTMEPIDDWANVNAQITPKGDGEIINAPFSNCILVSKFTKASANSSDIKKLQAWYGDTFNEDKAATANVLVIAVTNLTANDKEDSLELKLNDKASFKAFSSVILPDGTYLWPDGPPEWNLTGPAGCEQIDWNGKDGFSDPLKYTFKIPGDYTFTVSCGYSSKTVTITIDAVNLLDADVDSDNNGTVEPDSEQEDSIECVDPAQNPGKIIKVDDKDLDSDGITDYADMNIDVKDKNGNSVNIFAELHLRISPTIDLANCALRFGYSGSDPAKIKNGKLPNVGTLRIWKKPSNEERNPASVKDGGDYVEPTLLSSYIEASKVFGGAAEVLLYIEAVGMKDVNVGPNYLTEIINVYASPIDDSTVKYELSDSVRINPIQMQFVTKGKGDNDIVPTSILPVSVPRPQLTLDNITKADFNISNGYAKVTLSGTIKDPVADNLPEGVGRIQSVNVYVDGEAVESAAVTSQADGEPSFWRQHPWKGTFSGLAVKVPLLKEGYHVIRIETENNAAGFSSYNEITVNLSSNYVVTSPGTPEEQLVVNIYLPDGISDTLADKLAYYFGVRTPLDADPIFQEEIGEEDSKEFKGQLSNLDCKVTITEFTDLSDTERDTFAAEFPIVFGDQIIKYNGIFLETKKNSKIFRTIISYGGTPPTTEKQWSLDTVTIDVPSANSTYRPINIRIKGLLDNSPTINYQGKQLEIERSGEFFYLKGGSLGHFISIPTSNSQLSLLLATESTTPFKIKNEDDVAFLLSIHSNNTDIDVAEIRGTVFFMALVSNVDNSEKAQREIDGYSFCCGVDNGFQNSDEEFLRSLRGDRLLIAVNDGYTKLAQVANEYVKDNVMINGEYTIDAEKETSLQDGVLILSSLSDKDVKGEFQWFNSKKSRMNLWVKNSSGQWELVEFNQNGTWSEKKELTIEAKQTRKIEFKLEGLSPLDNGILSCRFSLTNGSSANQLLDSNNLNCSILPTYRVGLYTCASDMYNGDNEKEGDKKLLKSKIEFVDKISPKGRFQVIHRYVDDFRTVLDGSDGTFKDGNKSFKDYWDRFFIHTHGGAPSMTVNPGFDYNACLDESDNIYKEFYAALACGGGNGPGTAFAANNVKDFKKYLILAAEKYLKNGNEIQNKCTNISSRLQIGRILHAVSDFNGYTPSVNTVISSCFSRWVWAPTSITKLGRCKEDLNKISNKFDDYFKIELNNQQQQIAIPRRSYEDAVPVAIGVGVHTEDRIDNFKHGIFDRQILDKINLLTNNK